MHRAVLVLALVSSFSIAVQGEQAQESATDEVSATQDPPPIDLEEILSDPLSESDYREQKNCLRIRDVDDVEVLDETLVLFHGRRGELWLNQLSSQCYGLEQEMILRFKTYAGTYCRLDPFRGMPYFSRVAITAECRLGDFEPVDEIQVEALRIAVAERQEVSDMAKETRRQQRRQRKSED